MNLDENQYRAIVEFSPNMIWRSGTDALCDYFNRTWLDFTGRSMEQEIGNGWAEGVHSDDLERCIKIYTENFNNRKAFEMEYRLRRYDGEWRWINDRGVPFYNNKEFAGYIGSCIDITEKVEGVKLIQMAQTDGLTGIYNRQYFEELAKREFDKAMQYKLELCICMVDLDDFKKINDSFGHIVGDDILKYFANTMKKHLRNFDLSGRYGGDEFIILFPHTNKEEAVKALGRISIAFSKPYSISENKEITIRFSYGISSSAEESTFDKMVANADRAMYLSKEASKRNRPE